jgi:hypothetical protein
MRPPLSRAVLGVLLLSAPAGAVKVEVPVGEIRAGGVGNAAGAGAAVAPVQLSVLPLSGTLALGGSPTLGLSNGPVTAGAALQVAPALNLTARRAGPAASDGRPLPAPLPASLIAAPADSRPAAAALDGAALSAEEGAGASAGATPAEGAGLDGSAAAASVRFDGAAARSGGLLGAIKRFVPWTDLVPSYPGRQGETVRLEGRRWTLDHVIADGGGSKVWGIPGGRDVAIKILHPEMAALPHYGEELSILRAIKDNRLIPHARLVAASKDGRVMVKERFDGDTAAGLIAKGGFQRWQKDAWAGLAESLIRAGATGDLIASNLQYAHHSSRWILLDAGGVTDGAPADVLKQLLAPGLAKGAGVDPVEVLAALRGRLGPDSELWKRTASTSRAVPFLADALRALEARDASRPAPPSLAFGPGPARATPFDDSVQTRAQVIKRLGYNPWNSKHLSRHIHDQGKLNTELWKVDEPGKPALFMKKADWWMIQKELAVRRIVSHLFGRYFDVPHAFAVQGGADSWLVMERSDGTQGYGRNSMTLAQRMALGVLANVFGFYDLNAGNILFGKKGDRPTLLDFEQALGRRGPVPGRLPDEGILIEMPWLDGWNINHASDYHHAAREWRAKLADPRTVELIRADLLAAGYTAPEAASILATVAANTADLDATLQVDVEFANKFAAQRVQTP